MISYECDDDTLSEYACRLLERPTNFGGDDRYYRTHAPVLAKADYSDDILAESNYKTALDLLRAAADDGRDDTEVSDEHVIDAGIRHWAMGYCSEIFVQVYEGGCDEDCTGPCAAECGYPKSCGCEGNRDECMTACPSGCDGEAWVHQGECTGNCDGTRTFTAAWREACSILSALEGYPILDESDYSEREYERWQSNVNEALERAQREYEYDTEAQTAEIADSCHESLSDLYGYEPDGGIDWEKAEDIYREARDAYFSRLANEHLNAPLAGQLSLV
ncbi:hypothetical protein AB0A60_25725 [Streptomyces sp. NPDC046275]|uniref:hypothetical protein n=1 Tax=Streptomyces sp. NPDC046275 TaxID=3157201 RepID=UPI0033E7191F